VRVFAAFPIPDPVRASIACAFSRARSLAPRVKWVAPEGMHLTLHFFGEIPEQEIEGFGPVFSDPALQRPPIRARLDGAGFFPPSGTPRVLWVGIRQGRDEMDGFWARFTERLQPLREPAGPLRAWEPDRRGFSPHITVARPGAAPLDTRWAGEAELPRGEFLITECVLFQSLLGAGGPRYVPLRKITFDGGAA
jgi:2'-5' RNA ligase